MTCVTARRKTIARHQRRCAAPSPATRDSALLARAFADDYNAAMRRKTLFRLIGIVLVVGFGAYTAFWWVAAGRIKLAAGDWARVAHEQQLDVSWQTIRVAGYPFSFRLELGDAVISDKAATPAVELRAPLLEASVSPLNFHTIWADAPNGLGVVAGSDDAPLVRISAEAGDGAVAAGSDGAAMVWLTLHHPKADAGVPLAARTATAWATIPAHPAAGGLAVAALVDDLSLPAAPPDFGKTIDQLSFGLSLAGAWPSGPLRQAAAAWRDAGGTVELDHFQVRWGELGVTGSGTLALDGDLQPVGGLSGAISGYDQLMSALVAAGRVKASDARVARLALAMLGKVGADGRPEISSSLRIQNGEMFLGPAKLGKVPHIDW
jgi:hypothetical protein